MTTSAGTSRGLRALMALALPALLLAAVQAARAQPSGEGHGALADELRRCRVIVDNAARFACYEAIVLPGGGGAAPVRPAVAPTAQPAAPVTVRPPSVAAPTASAAAAPPSTAAAARDFGLPERSAAAAVESIDSSINGEFEGWTAGARLRLANGQVWQIVDGSNAAYSLRDPKVRVSRGLFGSFFISIDGVSQTPRVRRLQ